MTTNLYPPPMSNAIDLERLTRDMDFASWDNYPVWGDQDEPLPYVAQALAESYIRGLSDRNFTVMESFSGFQGHVCLGYLPPERQAALWTNQAIARGADRILYFRWRTAPYGQEQLCYGLFDTDDAGTARARVLSENVGDIKASFSRFAATPMESPACLVYSKDDARVLTEQYLSKGLYLKPVEWAQAGYDMEMIKWFAPLCRLQRQRRRQERRFGRDGAVQGHQPAPLPDGRPRSRRSAGRLGQERRPARARLPFRHAR